MREGSAADLAGESAWPDGPVRDEALEPLPQALLEAESSFYGRYAWCLDAFPPAGEVRDRLRGELTSLGEVDEGWPRGEVLSNVFLLSCALADTVDDYLAGEAYDFSQAVTVLPWLRPATRALERLLGAGQQHRGWRLRSVRGWRARWGPALDAFLQASVAAPQPEMAALAAASDGLAPLLAEKLPADLLARRAKVPAAFHSQDLTPHDILELAGRFVAAFPDRRRPLLVIGLRTAGSYFAPLVRAFLAARGYEDVEALTLRPKKGVAPWERAQLAHGAARGALAVVVDEPADTGFTLAGMVDALRRAGLPPGDVVVLLPVHPSRRDWKRGYESLLLSQTRLLELEPEDWHKQKLLEVPAAERRVQAYFRARGYASAAVLASPAADRFNGQLQRLSEEKFHTRLKRVYEVRLQDAAGRAETRYVLAKSVGWGWLGYHAFLAGQALAEFVPPVLGLREGILYTEWLPQSDPPALPRDRELLWRRAAAYVAARVRSLRLSADPGTQLDRHNQKGPELLAGALSGAYGSKPAAVLKRARIRAELLRPACLVPTLIDGKMRLQEWVRGPASILKTDFEHHGMGKTELNVADPACDLAEAILHFRLSPAEEQALIQHYREASGDRDVEERLFRHKLFAGTSALKAALYNLNDPRLSHRHHEFNWSYIDAWDFLTVHTARFCGQLCRPAQPPFWRPPLVVMDIDGVLDKQFFGYPSTTAAGIKALSLLHAHGCALALNTARRLAEVREYCQAYGCVGGVAEYGSVVLDAVAGRTRVLVTPESRDQLRLVAGALRRIPGVFLDDRYEYSLRAYTFERRRTTPLPGGLIQRLMANLGVDRLAVHQTYLDTAVLAREVDKGKGLLALLELAGRKDMETVAIGDSEPDLAMFSVAGRSFAPSHISGRSVARLLGCRIADRSYQPGLLSAVRWIVHPEGGRCPRCRAGRRRPADGLLWKLFNAADRRPAGALLRALADPLALQAFVR